jgi:hypothetical protein
LKPPLALIPDTVSNDTVKCLETLLREARKGKLTGIAFAGIIKGHGYIANSAGEAYRDPTFSIGMCNVLIKKLLRRVDGGNP